MLDLVPLAGAGRQVADRDGQPGLVGEAGQLDLPQPGAVAVGAAAVGGDQQWIASRSAAVRHELGFDTFAAPDHLECSRCISDADAVGNEGVAAQESGGQYTDRAVQCVLQRL